MENGRGIWHVWITANEQTLLQSGPLEKESGEEADPKMIER